MKHYEVHFMDGTSAHFSTPSYSRSVEEFGVVFTNSEERKVIPWTAILLLREWSEE